MTMSAYPSFFIFESPMTSIERNNWIVIYKQATPEVETLT